jgi:DNA-binding MarR family transcriptional regulator
MLHNAPQYEAPLVQAVDNSTLLMLGVLEQLESEHARGRSSLPLAAICKRLGIRMSTLQRHLTVLAEQDVISISIEKERPVVALTTAGRELCTALQPA